MNMNMYYVVTKDYYEGNVCMVTEDLVKAVQKLRSLEEPVAIECWRENEYMGAYYLENDKMMFDKLFGRV